MCVYVCVCNEKKSFISKFIHSSIKSYVYQSIGIKLDITFIFLHYERNKKEIRNIRIICLIYALIFHQRNAILSLYLITFSKS